MSKIFNLRQEQEIKPLKLTYRQTFWSGLYSAMGWIRGALLFVINTIKGLIFCLGLLALYYLWSFHAGYSELTILSQGDLKHLSGDLLKPKKETKK